MPKNKQIGDLNKKVRLSRKEISFAKKIHRRHIRRLSKIPNSPNPQANRYAGWIA
jgi:hypothetical protein